MKLNEKQPLRIIELLEKKIKIKDKKITILGLSFKADTDDIRNAPSIEIIRSLLDRGANVVAYDPKSMDKMKNMFKNVQYAENVKSALAGSDACLLLTEWSEFKKLTDKDFAFMKNKIIIEGRRILDKNKIRNFEGVCW
mgnify:FL=1